MPKKFRIPDGWETGIPEKRETGNYFINGSEKSQYFWDGRSWSKATKDIFGNYDWHEPMLKEPKIKCFKLAKRIYA